MIIHDCPSCEAGDHAGHVKHWGRRPKGIIDGDFCYCTGDCSERVTACFDGLFQRPTLLPCDQGSPGGHRSHHAFEVFEHGVCCRLCGARPRRAPESPSRAPGAQQSFPRERLTGEVVGPQEALWG